MNVSSASLVQTLQQPPPQPVPQQQPVPASNDGDADDRAQKTPPKAAPAPGTGQLVDRSA